MERPYNSSLSPCIMIFPLFLGNPMYQLILYIGAIHYICFKIATFILFIAMRNGNVGLLNTSAVLFHCFHHRYARSLLDRSKYFILGFRSPGIYWRYII